jgi:hypothetical protein
MDSKVEVEIEGVASAQLIRPDVAETKWLAFPLAAFAWGMGEGDAAAMFVEQLPDFDAWRVGGGVAFKW